MLVSRRRLGQTELPQSREPDAAAKAGKSKITSSATQNLKQNGIFDYAHLRVPLPRELSKSGIFTPLKNGAYPESYFLMVRHFPKWFEAVLILYSDEAVTDTFLLRACTRLPFLTLVSKKSKMSESTTSHCQVVMEKS